MTNSDPRIEAGNPDLSRSSEPPEPSCYPASEYLRLLQLIDARLAAIICNLAPFYHTPFDTVAAPIRQPLLVAAERLRGAIDDLENRKIP